MKRHDIRVKDRVKFKAGMTLKDKEKIVKFSSRISGRPEMNRYVRVALDKQDINVVTGCKETKKIPTQYANIRTDKGVNIAVQTRYLQVVERKHRHPLTSLFLD